MNEARIVEGQIDELTAEAAELAEGAGEAAEDIVNDTVRPNSAVKGPLSDAIEAISRAVARQPITSILLVGAFAYLWGLNRRR